MPEHSRISSECSLVPEVSHSAPGNHHRRRLSNVEDATGPQRKVRKTSELDSADEDEDGVIQGLDELDDSDTATVDVAGWVDVAETETKDLPNGRNAFTMLYKAEKTIIRIKKIRKLLNQLAADARGIRHNRLRLLGPGFDAIEWDTMTTVAKGVAKKGEPKDARMKERDVDLRKALDTALQRDILCPGDDEQVQARSNITWSAIAELKMQLGVDGRDVGNENSETVFTSHGPLEEEDSSEEEGLSVSDGVESVELDYEDELQGSEEEEEELFVGDRDESRDRRGIWRINREPWVH